MLDRVFYLRFWTELLSDNRFLKMKHGNITGYFIKPFYQMKVNLNKHVF